MSVIEKISDAIKGQKTQAFLSDGSKDVLFDVTISTSKSKKSDVTRHAIERGSDITDHVIESPESFSFSVILTDDNATLTDPSSYFATNILEREQILIGWMDSKSILTYYGHETDIEDVVLESCSRKKTTNSGAGLELDIALRKINIVSAQTTVINVKGVTAKKTDTVSGDKVSGKRKSWLKTLFS